MKTIEKQVYDLVMPYASEHNLEIYDVIYEKQGKDMYLSIYIDSEKGIRNDNHFEKFLNTNIRVSLFKPIDKQKEFEGILKEYTNDTVTISIGENDKVFSRKDIAIIKTVYDWNN